MKYFLLFCLGTGIFSTTLAQDKDLHVVATAGGTYQLNDIYLDWTLGEAIIQTLEKPSGVLSQGFHQPLYTLVSVQPTPADLNMDILMSNPFSDVFEIKMTSAKIVKGTFALYDMTGKLLWHQSFAGSEIAEKHTTSALSTGSYMLVVSMTEPSFVHAYEIVKTQ